MASLWPLTPSVHPQRLLKSAPSTEEQTNKTKHPRVVGPPLGTGREKGAPVYWCENDHYWEGKKRPDGVDWAADRVRGKKKVTRQNPDRWLRQWDKHLLGHCSVDGGLDLTLLSHTVNRPGRFGSVQGGDASAVTRGCGTVVPLISSCDHSKRAQRRLVRATPAEGFHYDSAHAKNHLHIRLILQRALKVNLTVAGEQFVFISVFFLKKNRWHQSHLQAEMSGSAPK